MGGMLGRPAAGVEEVDITINHAYKYPPKQGNYFSSHFIMGGERFETAVPEMYLFGENMDLNFLGSRPAPFPYPAPTANEPSKTLKALINIRKESLRFVKVPEETHSLKGSEPVEAGTSSGQSSQAQSSSSQCSAGASADPSPPPQQAHPEGQGFNIEFTFDCDVRCAITVMYFCTEEITNQGLVFTPRNAAMNSETYYFKRGANQQFAQATHIFYPAQHSDIDLLYSFEREVFPVVVHCVALEGEEPRQSQATIGVVEKHSDGFVLKALKQKLFVHGLCYLLQEIYGIENKTSEAPKNGSDDEAEDNGAECVICMCDLRDTLILPCRHLCLCNCCADSLRYQANNCPICRAPFRALLQIKALRKSTAGNPPPHSGSDSAEIPSGYEAVSLIEALNGPSAAPPVQPNAPPYNEMYVRLPQNPDRRDGDHSPTAIGAVGGVSSGAGNLEDSTTQTENMTLDGSTQMRMSVLLAAQETQEKELGLTCPDSNVIESGVKSRRGSEGARRKSSSRRHGRDKSSQHQLKDTVVLVNEVKKLNKDGDHPLREVKPSLQEGLKEVDASEQIVPGVNTIPLTTSHTEINKGGEEIEEEEETFDEPAKRKRVLLKEEEELYAAQTYCVDDVPSTSGTRYSSAKGMIVSDSDEDQHPPIDPGSVNPIYSPTFASCRTTPRVRTAVGSDESDDENFNEHSISGVPTSASSSVSYSSSKEKSATGTKAKKSHKGKNSSKDHNRHKKGHTLDESGDRSESRGDGYDEAQYTSPPTTSMPGTPLSNASDVSSNSAHSHHALLSGNRDSGAGSGGSNVPRVV